jgi:hypothetical protein
MELKGRRVEVKNIYQVESISVPPITSVAGIFYDDPRLISAVSKDPVVGAAQLAQRIDNWIEFTSLSNAEVSVKYTNGRTVPYKVKDLQTMGSAYGNRWLDNHGYGGGWADLEIFPVSRAAFKIDVREDNKTVVGAQEGVLEVHDFDWFKPNDDYNDVTPENSAGYIYGDGGWAQWAQLAAGRSKMGVWWRGVKFQANVEIFNRPLSLDWAAKTGVNSDPVVMKGPDLVYGGRPDGMSAFVNRVTVAVTYGKQSDQSGVTKTRPDVAAAIANGSCRAYVQEDPADPKTRFPSLYSLTVFNFKDTAPAGTSPENLWLYDVPAQQAIQTFGQGIALVDPDVAIQQSILTKAQSDAFFSKGTPVRGRIYYRGWAGDPSATRAVYNPNENELRVAVTGYIENP